MFVILWEFEVKPGCESVFESVYGPRGAWARLFERDPAYLGTHLFRDTNRYLTYLTLDRWSSRKAFEGFRRTHTVEYSSLDAEGEALTLEERHIGSFEATSKSSPEPH